MQSMACYAGQVKRLGQELEDLSAKKSALKEASDEGCVL